MAKTKQERIELFTAAYVANGGNGADAARKAGYSPNGAHVAAIRLLRNATVREAVGIEHQRLRDKHRLTADNVLRSLENALFFDPRKLYNADGTMKPITELDDSTVMGLQSVELGVLIDKRGKVKVWTKRVRWLDRNTARDQALKVLGRYTAEKSPTDDLLVTANERAAKSMGSLAARFKAVVAAHGGPKT